MERRLIELSGTPLALLLLAAVASNVHAMEQPIGQFTVVKGNVTVTHAAAPNVRQHVAPLTQVLFHDEVQTESKAHTKALFVDDTLLTVGENTRIQIDEYVFNPHVDQRSVIVNMIAGHVRALVGKHFAGPGSRFEIHTPTAVAAARGTYFIVWIENDGTTGMANIGDKGDVAFSAGGQMVVVKPGYYSMAVDGTPPTTPSILTDAPKISNVVAATDVREELQTNSTKATLHAVGPGLTPMPAFASVPMPGVADPVVASTSSLPVAASSTITGVVSTGTSVVTSTVQTVAGLAAPSAPAIGAITSTIAAVTPVVTTITAPVAPVVTTIIAPVAPAVTAVAQAVPITPPNVISALPVVNGLLH
ncbi:FecR domain-containing protein [Nitrospira sp. Nam74]